MHGVLLCCAELADWVWKHCSCGGGGCVGCAPALPGAGLCILQVNLVLAGSEDSFFTLFPLYVTDPSTLCIIRS